VLQAFWEETVEGVEDRSALDSRLDRLEDQSIYLLREGHRKFARSGMLWSMGKDSTVLLWLARKAFLGNIPFPLIHIDTSYKLPEMIAYRDAFVRENGLELIIGRNEAALREGMDHTRGRLTCCTALKTRALEQLVGERRLQGLFVGIRRDEDGTRAKERYFSPRNKASVWNYRDQPPEFWNQFKTHFGPEEHVRIHPILDWTELDVWEYIRREEIPILDLYFARGGRRYRSLGCGPCTGTIASEARTVSDIIEELRATKSSERSVRAQDQEGAYAMQQLRVAGYM
jgi:sulfate adenylyltransferase subunit 2